MANLGELPDLDSLENKIHYITDRLECGKMVMSNIDADIETLARSTSALIETKATATGKLRKHSDGGDEKVKSDGEKNPALKQGLDAYAETMDSVVSLEGMQVGQMHNVQLELKSFRNIANRARVQLSAFQEINEKIEKTQKTLVNAQGINVKIAQDAHLDGLKNLRQRAEAALIRELQEFEDERVQMLRQILGDFCHLNMEFHARALTSFCEAAAATKLIEPQSIEEVVGLRVRRRSDACCHTCSFAR